VGAIVGVVTPFYNTARHLPEAIESVLAQSHGDFRYTLVDNHSSDGSADIAHRYAKLDERVRVVSPPVFLGQAENYSFAVAAIDPAVKYCKIVEADNWIFPQCLERMLECAARVPEAGIIATYYLRGLQLRGGGIDVSVSHLTGREAARRMILGDDYYLGTPTTVLYRADAVRARAPFFESDRYHPDTEAAFDILRQHDLGFVHQVLSYVRVAEESSMGSRSSYQTHLLDRMTILERFGRHFLTELEFESARELVQRNLEDFLGESLLRLREKAFWDYQRGGLQRIGRDLPKGRIALAATRRICAAALNPGDSARRLWPKLRRRLAGR
jgi:glycosyltransferase involved in cell wall biosynthesis